MHSAVASVLMIVTMVSLDALPLMVGLSLMLGANLGSSLLPLWVTRAMPPLARQVPLMNFLIRGSVSIIMVIAINRSQIIEFLPNINDAQKVIFCHILFNLLLLLAVPFSGLLERAASKFMARELANLEEMPVHYRSVINHNNLDNIEVAIASIRRETQRMLLLIEEMMLPIMELFKEYDVKQMDRIVKKIWSLMKPLMGRGVMYQNYLV